MHSSVRKIGILIIVVVILPVLFFSAFEIGNLKNNEKVIQNIYKNQLSAILFSVNQYSDDVISGLASRIENKLNSSVDSGNGLSQVISERPAVKCLFLFDRNYRFLFAVPGDCDSLAVPFSGQLAGMDSTIRRLETYLRGGYRKIESMSGIQSNQQQIVFLLRDKDRVLIALLVLDPEKFINEVLDPKIQEIARDQFHIAAFRQGEQVPFYNSNKQYTPGKITEKRPFWLLTNYTMGIELKDLTIEDLARNRVKNNLILIGFMDIILLAGAWLIFRNISKQVELSQLKSDFVANVSHEIRTPLALISMYVETLEMGRIKSAEKIKEYYGVIMNETSRLSAMVNRILNFSQIENRKRKYTFSETDLNGIVDKVLLTFHYTLEKKGFVHSFEPVKDLPVMVADGDAVYDALANLIDNAMKYSTEHNVITVRTGKDDHYLFVEVQDQGIGISKKSQKFIFDKFYRVTEKDLANRIKGSGLGLAIVKHIMDAHGGKIVVNSTPGAGSLFRLLFPVR